MNAGPVCIAAASGVGSCGGIAEVYVTGCGGRRKRGEGRGQRPSVGGREKINQIVRRFQGTVPGSEREEARLTLDFAREGEGNWRARRLARARSRAGALT